MARVTNNSHQQILTTMRINKHLNSFIYVLLGIILGILISFITDMYMQYNHEKEMQIQELGNLPSLEEFEKRIDEIRYVDTIKTLSYISCEEREFDYYKDEEGYVSQSGFIPDESTAVRVCMPILQKIYGNDVLEDMPISICLSSNGIWKLHGHVKYGSNGGSFYMEIDKKSGKVLKVLHGK